MTLIQPLQDIDTTLHPSFFGSFEIKDCWDQMGPVVLAALDNVIQKCTQPDTPERRKALYMHDNPAGNLFSLSFGLCEAERLGFVVEYLNFLCIIDDVLEDYPQKESLIEHEILGEVLGRGVECDTQPTLNVTPNTRMEWIEYLHNLKARMMDVDPVRTPALLRILEADIRAREDSVEEFNTMEEYLPFRLRNFDYESVSQMMLWAMNVDLLPEEANSDLLAKVKASTGAIAVLANDYFSWEREKRQQQDSDRIRNGVAVFMKELDVPEGDAKEAVKQIIIEEEEKVRELMKDVEVGAGFSDGLRRYLSGLQLFAGGYNFWCATCPRYSRPQGDSE
ncbi:hypothetical protein AAF712_012859 [Marasmius tenuissimus]|uniref:Isoprenoid synthase domain-containing protein n=1 Tax=Marasmius tenuissimus TaxID=585030 RepID=A0ABR2ZHB0_9AGAR